MNQELIRILKIIAAVTTIALAAQLTIDIGAIPITGQTLALLFWAFLLSPKDTIIALLVYLLLGFLGAPIFANGAHGIEKLYGGSGGYLIGFLIAGGLVSYLQVRYKSSAFISILSLTTFGTIIILIFGVGRLIQLYGLEKGMEHGFYPFWQGAILKIIIGSMLVWSVKKSLSSSKFFII